MPPSAPQPEITPLATTAAGAATGSPTASLLRRWSHFQEWGLLGVIALLVGILAFWGGNTERRLRDPVTGQEYLLVKNKLLNIDRLVTLAKDTSFIAIMAVGATLVIVSGGIDVSVGGIYVLAGLAGATFLRYAGPTGPDPNWSPLAVVFITGTLCLATGMLCGLLNGAGVVGLQLHPFIITLGTMSLFRGLAFVTTKAQSIGQFHPAFVDGFISRKLDIGGHQFIYPVPLVILILITLWGMFFLASTVTGRQLLAIGGNELAARYCGLPVPQLKMLTYSLAGLLAGVAAMINIGYHGSAASGDGSGYELEVIAAAVVGGASLSGGKGTALGAVLGALIIRLIMTGIVILDLDQNYSQMVIGTVIVVAAALDRWQARWRT